jgi:general secretion pathway protein G
MPSYLKNRLGLSFIELIVTMIILGILAGGILPMVRMTAQRAKEDQLRRNLRAIRSAIDEFHKECKKTPPNLPSPQVCGRNGYPENLDILVDGATFPRGANVVDIKFLRRKLYDPFIPLLNTSNDQWGWEVRSLDYSPGQPWNNTDVFDVYSISGGTAINGTKYEDW